MNSSLIFRDELGRFAAKPVVREHTKVVNPLGASATIWEKLPYDFTSVKELVPSEYCYAVVSLEYWAQQGQIGGYDPKARAFDFSNLTGLQHFKLGEATAECELQDCKTCLAIRSLYYGAI
ncbi:hypothetical protein QII92_gp3 [ssRNA phage SRR5466725_4]|uniref:Uncharacterized protein n=1 Tax=ssRNA phage SRR5466725_4 TaxID=2786423 RepID=A0A8S5L4E3_9VIRU|nr:hypothetical protein QII92_gp3 [ssRNA phage SRR5466725_4]DAD52403.1 TPA_asm: hypothetical protein [ssRNA phage SRR5466725_4]